MIWIYPLPGDKTIWVVQFEFQGLPDGDWLGYKEFKNWYDAITYLNKIHKREQFMRSKWGRFVSAVFTTNELRPFRR